MIKYYLLVILLIIALPRMAYSFNATSSGGLPGVLITNFPSGSGQCVTSTGLTTGQWGNCGSGNLPSIPGTGGEFLSENTSSASWTAFSGDFTCSTSSLGLCTVTKTSGIAFGTLATASTSGSNLLTGNGSGGVANYAGATCTNQALTALSASGSGTCNTITSSYVNNTIALTGTDINTSNQVIATHLSAALPVNQGGTGTTTPSLVQGTNITITGSWPNQTINSSGGSGSGTVNSGSVGNPAYYASTGTAVSSIANIIHAGSGTLSAAFTALGSNPGIVVADPGQAYTVSAPLTWGTSNDQTLEVYGQINCTDTTGGRDCLDEDVHGHLVGMGPGDGSANNGCMITDSGTANITSLITNASHTAGDGFDLRNCLLDPNTSSTITKGELWLSGAQGFNTVGNIRFTNPPVGGSNSGIIWAVDDNGGVRQWNQIDAYADSVTCGGAAGATGINISVSSSGAGAGGSNFTFLGGSVVDCGTSSKLVNISGNSTNQVKNVKFINTYFEPDGSGDDVDIVDGYAIDLDNVYFNQANSSTQTNCVSITGQAGNTGVVHISGRAATSACTNVINNAISSYTKTTAGNIDYAYTGTNGGQIYNIDGPVQMNSIVGLTTPLSVAQGGTGTASTLTGIVRGGSPITAAELSGDVTTSGSNATTVVKVNGAAIPTSATALASNSSNQIIAATYQGNGTKVQLSTGTTSTNDCVKYDANGNTVDSNVACGSGTNYATVVNSSGTSVTATCSATTGTHPSIDLVWQVMTGNTTYTTPASSIGCIEGDRIEAYFIQGDNHSYTLTAAGGTGTTLITPTLYTVPTSTSTNQGYFIHVEYEYHAAPGGTATPEWELLGQNTYPLTPIPVGAGGTGSTTGGLLTTTSTNSNVFGIGFDFIGTPTASMIEATNLVYEISVPANYATPTSSCTCGTNPSETDAYTVKCNGASQGTFSLSSSCVLTLPTNSAYTCTAGQRFEMDAPATVSGKDIACTVAYTR